MFVSNNSSITRRSFAAIAAAAPLALSAPDNKSIPIGLELYSVRGDLKNDLMGTVRAVGRIGYQCVEFFSPYLQWTPEYAKQVRKTLDDLGLRCYSTHNDAKALQPAGLPHAIELNQILGAKFIVMASAGRPATLDGWKAVAATLSEAAEKLRPLKLRPGYHNHQLEFTPVEGKRPIEIIAANTPKDVMLQLDLGTCVEAGSNPVEWINANPGRINSLHCKDWSRTDGYKVLFGEGEVPWKEVFAAAEKTGGVEFYLIEQEGSKYSEIETVERCLANFRKLRS
jgi:sugar phosphate isomerase/epimerase